MTICPKTSTLPGIFHALFWISPWQRLSLVPALLKQQLNPTLILLQQRLETVMLALLQVLWQRAK